MMDEQFEIPVTFRNEEILFPAHLVQAGYTHRFVVDVYGTEVQFEPDEEQTYRAILEEMPDKKITVDLLQAIAHAIEEILR